MDSPTSRELRVGQRTRRGRGVRSGATHRGQRGWSLSPPADLDAEVERRTRRRKGWEREARQGGKRKWWRKGLERRVVNVRQVIEDVLQLELAQQAQEQGDCRQRRKAADISWCSSRVNV
eukprot:767713-Hanusia_phi.AAC.3